MQQKQETQVWLLGRDDPLEKEMETHTYTLGLENWTDKGAWRATVHGVAKALDVTSRLSIAQFKL